MGVPIGLVAGATSYEDKLQRLGYNASASTEDCLELASRNTFTDHCHIIYVMANNRSCFHCAYCQQSFITTEQAAALVIEINRLQQELTALQESLQAVPNATSLFNHQVELDTEE